LSEEAVFGHTKRPRITAGGISYAVAVVCNACVGEVLGGIFNAFRVIGVLENALVASVTVCCGGAVGAEAADLQRVGG